MATKSVSKKASAKTTAKKTSAKAVSKAKKEVIEAVDAIEDAVEATSDSIVARVSNNVAVVQNIAKKVWFANLGVAGRGYEETVALVNKANDELQTRYTQLKQSRQSLLTDLVSRGEKVQGEAQTRISEGRATVEEQIEAAKDRLVGLTSVVDIPSRLQDLSNKLESLSKGLKKTA